MSNLYTVNIAGEDYDALIDKLKALESAIAARVAAHDAAERQLADVKAAASEALDLREARLRDERAAHERTRAELTLQRDQARGCQADALDQLATAQARVSGLELEVVSLTSALGDERAAGDVADCCYEALRLKHGAAESALASARKLLEQGRKQYGWQCPTFVVDALSALSANPTPAPVASLCAECAYLVDIHAPCVGCPVVAEIHRRGDR